MGGNERSGPPGAPTSTQGGHAVKTGGVLERMVVGTLGQHGFEVVYYRDYMKAPRKYGAELLLRHVPYTGLYGGRGFTEFLLRSERYQQEVRIECKWQQAAGSVDEKLPFTLLNAIDALPENEIIILIDGDGFRAGAKEWIREAAESRRFVPDDKAEKDVRVMSATEFLTWANTTFR